MHENTRAALPGDLVARLRAVDHMSVEDCFLQSYLLALAADEIGRLRAIIRVNGLRAGATHADVDAMLYGAALSAPPASDGECCQRTRLRGAPCPAGRTCPHDTPPPPGWPTLENVR